MAKRTWQLELQELTPAEYRQVLAATASRPAQATHEKGHPRETLSQRGQALVRQGALWETVAALEAAAEREPTEWVYLYKACDLYIALKQFERAVAAGERALRLRPDDPRSFYALGAAYQVLTQARYAQPAYAGPRPDASTAAVPRAFDPAAAAQALDSLGLTVDQATARSQRLFEQTLRFELKPAERRFIREVCLRPLSRRRARTRPANRAWRRAGGLVLAAALGVAGLAYALSVVTAPSRVDLGQSSLTLPTTNVPPTISPAPAGLNSPAAGAAPAETRSQPACLPGARFRALAQSVGASILGDCLEPERINPLNGNAEQLTTRGLMALHPADNVASFTDGARSWYLCPDGLFGSLSNAAFRCPRAPGGTLLADDFDDPARAGLARSSSHPAQYASGYAGGEYVIRTLDPSLKADPAEFLSDTFEDSSLAVDVRLIGPPQQRYVALICRYQEQAASHYRLTLAPNEGWLLLTRVDGEQPVQLVGPVSSAAVRSGNQSNHLELDCVGDNISARVNGAQVLQARDGNHRQGALGLSVSVLPDAGATVEARFDNLVVTQR